MHAQQLDRTALGHGPREFDVSICDYEAMCAEEGIEPERPYSGRFARHAYMTVVGTAMPLPPRIVDRKVAIVGIVDDSFITRDEDSTVLSSSCGNEAVVRIAMRFVVSPPNPRR
jgi:hypothetical protein